MVLYDKKRTALSGRAELQENYSGQICAGLEPNMSQHMLGRSLWFTLFLTCRC